MLRGTDQSVALARDNGHQHSTDFVELFNPAADNHRPQDRLRGSVPGDAFARWAEGILEDPSSILSRTVSVALAEVGNDRPDGCVQLRRYALHGSVVRQFLRILPGLAE